jgi:hypothetical protein
MNQIVVTDTSNRRFDISNPQSEIPRYYQNYSNVGLLSNTAYYVSFGPHGPREPGHREGDGLKIVLGVVGMLGLSGLLFSVIRSMGTLLLLELEVLLVLLYRDP